MNRNETLSWIERKIGGLNTPLYLYDASVIEESVREFRSLLPQESRLYYSMKANPQPEVIRFLKGLSVGVEVSSSLELGHALKIVDTQRVIVGGICKSGELINEAARNQIPVIVDSQREWNHVVRGNQSILPILRLHIEGQGGPFGIEPDQAITMLNQLDSRAIGLHFHAGSQLGSTEILANLAKMEGYAERIQRSREVALIHIGIGLGVPYKATDGGPDLADLREKLSLLWQRDPWNGIPISAEAGRALVARSGTFVCRVVDKKTIRGETFLLVDGGLNVHNPGVGLGRFFQEAPALEFPGNNEKPRLERVSIVGNLCTQADCLARNVLCPELEIGSLIAIPNSGAYCATTGLWGFNSQRSFSEIWIDRAGSHKELESIVSVYERRNSI